MARLRRFFTQLYNLRSHPNRVVRLIWWTAALLLLRMILISEPLRGTAIAVISIYAMGISTFAALWGLMHPRFILQVRSLALRWSLVLSIVGTLCLVSIAGAAFSESTNLAFPTGAIFLFSLLVILPLFFVLALPVSLYGAALSTWDSRKQPDPSEAARRGVNAIWWAIGTAFLAGQLIGKFHAPDELYAAVFFIIPLLARDWSRKPRQDAMHHAFQALLDHMDRDLVRKRLRRDGTVRTLDLRGAALGIFAASIVLVWAGIGILIGLRAPLLASLIQLRNTTSRYMLRPNTDFPLTFLQPREKMLRQADAIRTARRKIVILEMDGTTRYAAHQDNSSEARVQTQILDALESAHPALIVLPLPIMDNRRFPVDHYLPDTLPTLPKDIEHTLRDTPKLYHAVEEAGNIALLLPDTPLGPGFSEELAQNPPRSVSRQSLELRDRLAKAAEYRGVFGIGSYGTARLSVITMGSDNALPSVALLALSAVSAMPENESMMQALADQVVISGRRVPLIAQNRIVIDFENAEPGHDFARISYRDVLENRPAFMPTTDKEPGSEGAGRWLQPKDYLRDKIVILDTFAPFTRETPIGNMASNELLAYATSMLLSGEYLGRVGNRAMTVLTLLLAAGVGHWCVRKPPLHAGWRLAVACIVVAALCTGFILQGVWFDPVVPIMACVATFLLVTQFTFGMEQRVRTEHRRLLDRLVAPEFLEELLEDPEGKLGLQGRRQSLCILFADVRGFTQFAEGNSPEQVVESINAYMAPLTQSLLENGGILDKYTGDGLMALFRISGNANEGVIQAVHAALAMKHAADRVSERLRQEGKTVLNIGFGLHYGEAIVGLVGMPPDKVNYTALGHAVVISQRLQSIAAGGEIVISEDVFLMLGDVFEVSEGELVSVKGITIPVRPYRVLSSNTPPDENGVI